MLPRFVRQTSGDRRRPSSWRPTYQALRLKLDTSSLIAVSTVIATRAPTDARLANYHGRAQLAGALDPMRKCCLSSQTFACHPFSDMLGLDRAIGSLSLLDPEAKWKGRHHDADLHFGRPAAGVTASPAVSRDPPIASAQDAFWPTRASATTGSWLDNAADWPRGRLLRSRAMARGVLMVVSAHNTARKELRRLFESV